MEEIWWERIPNALAFISDIVDALINEKSIVLQYSSEIPWYRYMVCKIKEEVDSKDFLKNFEDIEATNDPGRYMLEEYCKYEIRAKYRPTKSYARFLAENDDIVLHQRYLWIHSSSMEEVNAWQDVVSEYLKCRPNDKERAVFIIECNDGDPIRPRKGIKPISYDRYISDYDRSLFAMLSSSTVPERPIIKSYLAELSAIVLGNDIELCAECLKDYSSFLEDAYLRIEKVIEDSCKSDGTSFNFPYSREEIKNSIWRAQIKTIYPLLEEYREDFVKRYRPAIQKELPITSSFGEQYAEVEEVELGTLAFMADSGRLFLSDKESKALHTHKDARNKLSHLNILSFEEIQHLFQ